MSLGQRHNNPLNPRCFSLQRPKRDGTSSYNPGARTGPSMQISLKSVQTFELSHSHRNTQTLCALYKHVHLVGPTESQHSLLFYKSYTQHGTNVARERTHRIHRKIRHRYLELARSLAIMFYGFSSECGINILNKLN